MWITPRHTMIQTNYYQFVSVFLLPIEVEFYKIVYVYVLIIVPVEVEKNLTKGKEFSFKWGWENLNKKRVFIPTLEWNKRKEEGIYET